MESFRPPWPLTNGHVQTCLASVGPRRVAARWRAASLCAAAEPLVLESPEGRLQGFYTPHPDPVGLASLIHGWEGSARSAYLLGAAAALYRAGFSVFRLNLRDHGDTHALNELPFHAARLDEVAEAVRTVALRYPHPRHVLVGFSLGGNFALRLALDAPARGTPLDRVAAVCPVLDPAEAMRGLQAGPPLYHHYFLRKWLRSLRKKQKLHPALDLGLAGFDELRGTLWELHERVIPRATPYPDAASYFRGYTLSGEMLSKLEIPCELIASRDDPVLSIGEIAELPPIPALTVALPPFGGHCGFLENYRLGSWAERTLVNRLGEEAAA